MGERSTHTGPPPAPSPTNTLTSSFQLHLFRVLLVRICGSNRITANNCVVGLLLKAPCLGNNSIKMQLLHRGPGLYQPGKEALLTNLCKDPID